MTQDHAQTYLTRPWLTHYEAGVPHEFHSSDRVMPDLLRENARDYGSRPAVSFLGASLNYTQLWQQVQALAAALQKSGVQPGDRVAIMLPNLPQFVVSFYGALLAGAVVVNTSPLYVADELAHQLQDSGASTLIILDSLLPRYLEVQGGVPVKRVFVARVEDALAFPKNLLYPIKQRLEKQHVKVPWSDHILPLRSVIASQKGAPQPVTLRPDDVALLQYTGGTTGLPKGAMLTHRNLIANAEQAWSWFSELKKGEEVGLGAIPYFHVYGMTASMNLNILGAGHTVLVPNPRDLKMVLSEIQRTKPSLFRPCRRCIMPSTIIPISPNMICRPSRPVSVAVRHCRWKRPAPLRKSRGGQSGGGLRPDRIQPDHPCEPGQQRAARRVHRPAAARCGRDGYG
ncbi:AMP-binding protein [Deinococcus radiophilus]|uniref:AMP-binding protein n=1 Tax=Deinococcus radiophilus TaxID=32062 RepID=UPI0036063B5C